jgi:predicted RNA methylase
MPSTTKLYLRRISDSLAERGVRGTFQALSSFLTDMMFDLRYGTDTMRWVPLAGLTIRSANVQEGNRYQATKYLHLKHFLDAVEFPSGSVFVDFGSGKGRVVLVASMYPFKRVVGIEFASELCAVARQNCDIFVRKVPNTAPIDIIEGDVLQHEIQPDENVFFMYHPFHTVVLKQVLAKVAESARRHPRPIYLIYHAPIYRDLISATPPFVEVTSLTLGEAEFALYSNGVVPANARDAGPAVESDTARRQMSRVTKRAQGGR